MLRLAVSLYGGFSDIEELCSAYSAEELPQDKYILYEGMLTGGYCRIAATSPIESWQPSDGVNINLDLYESEETYLHSPEGQWTEP